MRNSTSVAPVTILSIICAALAGCGGGGSADAPIASAVTSAEVVTSVPNSMSGTGEAIIGSKAAPTLIPDRGAPLPTGGSKTNTAPSRSITTFQLTSSATAAQSSAAVTFGQAFAQGDVRSGETLVGKTAAGAAIPLQVNVKARHPDGSVRHAIITAQLPSSAPKQSETITLSTATATAPAAAATPAALLGAGFTAGFTATIGGVRYTASADEMLKSGKYTVWLNGPLANEWIVGAPLKTADGVPHPHLTARFAIRSYAGSNNARVDVTVENGWAYEAAPQNFTYDAQVLVGGQPVYTQNALEHYHHARWRKVYWWGTEPKLEMRHNTAYLIASKALPNYDQSLVIKEATIASWSKRWTTGNTAPMQAGVGQPYMPTTGARSDIGLMPAWNALYLLSMDQRLKDISLGMSTLAGSWSVHYRNKQTDRPVTLAEYPYITVIGNAPDTKNPKTQQREAFPACPATLCKTPMVADTSHQAAFSYVPYLVSGDYFHLEELLFWANWSSFYGNPGYRENLRGLVKSDQVRGQAWTLRTVAEAAYIVPDDDPQKAGFTNIVNNNIDWYNENYTNNPNTNNLGVLTHGYAIVYDKKTGLAPWQDDFFTAAVGRMAELGFDRAQSLLTWKSKFSVERMVGDGYCWIEAPAYSMKVRDSETSPLYATIGDVYKFNHTADFLKLGCASAEMAANLKLRVGAMVGYVTTVSSQSIIRPALAYSASVNSKGKQAWDLYAKRPFQPDYAAEPQFAIVPR
ncbi:hypothetical protein [Telluria beijingensis]|uniref:RIFT barrel domain-containing protein n=1 Tax=Telluria beijingensis TaxID=3068633 RepID=UPI0027954E8F|nr:hypothetical protein [Massilia sp. REN29]